MPKQPPRLMVGELSNRVYLITRYRDLGEGRIEALGVKHDVTNEVGAVIAELDRRGLELTPVVPEGETP